MIRHPSIQQVPAWKKNEARGFGVSLGNRLLRQITASGFDPAPPVTSEDDGE